MKKALRMLAGLAAALLLGGGLAIVPAGPAAAGPLTCYEWHRLGTVPSGHVATVCVSYVDLPGDAWETTGVRVWNPPCCDFGTIWAKVYFNDNLNPVYWPGGLGENVTRTDGSDHTGTFTTAFELYSHPTGTYCVYVMPAAQPDILPGTCR